MQFQSVMTLNVDRLRMSLLRMGKASDEVNILDEVDLTCSLDNQSSSSHQTMDIEMTSKPIVFRASYRDITLISSIVNNALALFNSSQSQAPSPTSQITSEPTASHQTLAQSTVSTQAEARAFISTEKVTFAVHILTL